MPFMPRPRYRIIKILIATPAIVLFLYRGLSYKRLLCFAFRGFRQDLRRTVLDVAFRGNVRDAVVYGLMTVHPFPDGGDYVAKGIASLELTGEVVLRQTPGPLS